MSHYDPESKSGFFCHGGQFVQAKPERPQPQHDGEGPNPKKISKTE